MTGRNFRVRCTMTSEISTQVSAALLRSTNAVQVETQVKMKGAVVPTENIQQTVANEIAVKDNRAKTEEKETTSPRENLTENVTKEDVDKAINEIKQQMDVVGREINFSVDEDLNIVIIKVINKDTEEVVRQIPTEEVVEIARNIEENKGLIFQEEV